MKTRKQKFSRCVRLLPVLLVLSCAGLSEKEQDGRSEADDRNEADIRNFSRETPVFANDVFIPAPLPVVLDAEGVGELEERGLRSFDADDRRALSDSFKEAYTEVLLRGADIAGVLGGDMVHGWPSPAPITWVQNWRVKSGRPNSWGISALVLAARGIGNDRVFLVQGDMLHAYGLGKGLGGANGAAGYGAPCGDEFMYRGGRAQRFDFGLLGIDEQGDVFFLPGAAPSTENEVPGLLGQSDRTDPVLAKAFQSAWKSGIDSGLSLMEPAAPVVTVDFENDPWVLPVRTLTDSGDEQDGVIKVRKIHYQGMGAGEALFVLTEASFSDPENSVDLPLCPHIVKDSFLGALLSPELRLKGSESLRPAQFPSGYKPANELTRAILDSIALYGIPLSSALPRDDEHGSIEAQRFSRGWFVRRL